MPAQGLFQAAGAREVAGVELGQPSQEPSIWTLTTPSLTSSTVIMPPWDSIMGRSSSSAVSTAS